MFTSTSLKAHLTRGGIGIAFLVGAFFTLPPHPLFAISLAVIGLIALRGCPMCWTLGLIAKLSHRKECTRCLR